MQLCLFLFVQRFFLLFSEEQMGNFEDWTEHDDSEEKFCDVDGELLQHVVESCFEIKLTFILLLYKARYVA